MRGSIRMTPAASMTKVGKWAIMGLPQPNKSNEGRYAAGEKAAPAFLCQSSVRSRQRPQRQAQRRKGEEGVFGQARGMPPAPFHRGMDRERAALGRMSGLWGTTRTLRRGLRSARRVTPFAPANEAAPAFRSQSSVLSRHVANEPARVGRRCRRSGPPARPSSQAQAEPRQRRAKVGVQAL
jgi:hypothetical protein